ncbi:threonine dehydratase [Kutzneria sp. CA-103260]|nr:threonine dehydratase [Kutzneria sp. CA-103260]
MITGEDIRKAATRLGSRTTRTPLLASPELDAAVGASVLCKAENLQRTGAFKFRGVLNHLLAIPERELAQGVIAASSGNHAHALAVAAKMLDAPATVVIPQDVPQIKLAAVQRHGAKVVYYDRLRDDRDALVAELAADEGLTVVPSANSARVMAGAGTVGLEILQDAPDISTLVVPIGGGGLAAGCATIAKDMSDSVRVIGVEPAGADDTALSLRLGHRVVIPPSKTIADGLGHTSPSPQPFAVLRGLLDDVVVVDDDAISETMALCLEHLKVLIEPSGACALAAVAANLVPTGRGRIAAVLSGGNVDWPTFRRLVDLAGERRGNELSGMHGAWATVSDRP